MRDSYKVPATGILVGALSVYLLGNLTLSTELKSCVMTKRASLVSQGNAVPAPPLVDPDLPLDSQEIEESGRKSRRQ